MPLSKGDRLGPYQILRLEGHGGMGEVYRAHDPRLRRDVAIKTSLQRFDERFEREARAIAALNHPNICGIYDVGPDYLVMELVEGPTLKERLDRGAILLPEDGAVKVLDFGLAKVGTAPPAAETEASPTFSMTFTQPGVILGTAAY